MNDIITGVAVGATIWSILLFIKVIQYYVKVDGLEDDVQMWRGRYIDRGDTIQELEMECEEQRAYIDHLEGQLPSRWFRCAECEKEYLTSGDPIEYECGCGGELEHIKDE